METLFLLNTLNSLNIVNCCGNTDLPLLVLWDLEFLTVVRHRLLCWDLMSCLVAFLCFLSGCASWQTDSWCSLLEVIFLYPMHLSHAEISGFAQWLVSFHSSLQQLVKAGCCWYHTVSCWAIKQKRQLRSTTVEGWKCFWMFNCLLISWVQRGERKKKTMKFLQHLAVECSGNSFCALWQLQKFFLERDGLVRRICFIFSYY